MVRFLRGFFGSREGYAMLDYEVVPIGPITGSTLLAGQLTAGGCAFTTAIFGSR